MAVSSARLGYSRSGVLSCVTCIVLLTIAQVKLIEGKKHRAHPPVRAFFQGHCSHNFCDQRCRDIDNVGYVCDCYQGYRLNSDGITCSHITANNDVQEYNLQKPEIVKIITIDDGKDSPNAASETTSQSNSVQPDTTTKSHDPRTHKSAGSVKSSTNNIDVKLNRSTEQRGSYKVVIEDTNSTLGPIKIEMFDQSVDAPLLESHALTSEDSIKTEKLSNLEPNPVPKHYYSKKKWQNVYTNQVRRKEEKCDEFSCQSRGNCVDDGTVYRRKVRCDCRLGYLGKNCEKEVEVRYPRFYGNSYLALPVLRNGNRELDIFLEFKPTAKFGLLFFSSEFEDARSDFFAIALKDGYLEFRYDCGTGMGVVRSNSTVTMSVWNTVKISRQDSTATVWLNNDNPVTGNSKGSYSRLTLRLNLYLGGYDNMKLIVDKVGTEKGYVGCVEQVVVNGYKYDLRKSNLVGDSEFGANVGECSEGVCDSVTCHNSGLCQIISADKHVCLCPIGTGGENCQHKTQVHIPEFQGHSYLEFTGLGRTALLFLEVELVIKPTKLDGTILYNGYTVDRSGDFFSLALHDGYLEFRFDLGTGPAVIRSEKRVSVNVWHWVKVSRTGLEGVLEVDGRVAGVGQAQGAFTQLSLTQNLYVGGHRNYDETSRLANLTSSFDGCIQKIVINNKPLKLLEEAIFGVNVESCEHPCVGEPCLNAGECVPQRDGYSCYCPLGYTGNNCQDKVDEDITSPRFTGESYLAFTEKWLAKRVGGDKIDIRLAIKPESTSGLVFWSGPDVMLATSDYVALGFRDGALQFSYNLGSGEAVISYNNSRLFDGMWHYIHAQRNKQDGFLSIDGKEIVEGNSKGSYTMLNTNKILYIGGTPDVSQATSKKFSGGYVGCLQDMVLAEDYTVRLLQTATVGRNIKSCS